LLDLSIKLKFQQPINTTSKDMLKMKPRTLKIIYWFVTILFSLAILMGVIPNDQGKAVMEQLGYPPYLMIILGTAKVLGVISIIQWKFKTLKEWAYSGFTIDMIGASASFYFSKNGMFAVIMPLIFLAVMFVSYFLWKKVDNIKKAS